MLLSTTISVPLSTTSLSLKKTSTSRNNLVVLSQQQPQLPITNFTISDDALISRGFKIRRNFDCLNLDELNSVFAAVGFPRRDTDKLRVALENTDALLWIEHEKTKRLVAFARATGDGVFNSIIWDVVVDPNFQGFGLGKAVMERLVTVLLEKGITNIALYSEPRVLGFYRPLGFVADPDGIRGMVYSRKQKIKS